MPWPVVCVVYPDGQPLPYTHALSSYARIVLANVMAYIYILRDAACDHVHSTCNGPGQYGKPVFSAAYTWMTRGTSIESQSCSLMHALLILRGSMDEYHAPLILAVP
jgi:hypothetical protein